MRPRWASPWRPLSWRHLPLDALPDISDVQVIIHTPWEGQPPSVMEDQVTYPIVTTLLAAHASRRAGADVAGRLVRVRRIRGRHDLYWPAHGSSNTSSKCRAGCRQCPSGLTRCDRCGLGLRVRPRRPRTHPKPRGSSKPPGLVSALSARSRPRGRRVATIGGFVSSTRSISIPTSFAPSHRARHRHRSVRQHERGRRTSARIGRRRVHGARLGYLRSLDDLRTVPVARKTACRCWSETSGT